MKREAVDALLALIPTGCEGDCYLLSSSDTEGPGQVHADAKDFRATLHRAAEQLRAREAPEEETWWLLTPRDGGTGFVRQNPTVADFNRWGLLGYTITRVQRPRPMWEGA